MRFYLILRRYQSLSTLKEVCYYAAWRMPSRKAKKTFVGVNRSTTCVSTHLGPEVNSRHKKNTTNHSCVLLSSHWSCYIYNNSFKNLWKVFNFIPPNVIFNQEHFCSVFFRRASDFCPSESSSHQISHIGYQTQMVQNHVVIQLPIPFLIVTVPEKLQYTNYFLTRLLMSNLSLWTPE